MSKGRSEWKKILVTDEEKQFMARLMDKISRVEKNRQLQRTDFVDPHLCQVAKYILKEYPSITWYKFGGHEEAERQRIIVMPDFLQLNEADFGVVLINCELSGFGMQKNDKITHRDYLGALLSTGIKREKTGDIWVLSQGCVVALSSDIAQYVLEQSISVKGNILRMSLLDINEFVPPVKKSKLFDTTVSSLRLDSVAAKAFSTSRTKITSEILSGNMKINWQEVKRQDYLVKEGDVLSLRGKGRAVIKNVIGQTKKGRMKLTIECL